jgi:hypothetical protein
MPPGPNAKHPSVRARRNTTSTKAKLRAQPKPAVPPLPEDTEWHSRVKDWWQRVWSSPMRGEWADADLDGLYRGALLMQRLWSPDKDGNYVDTKDMKALSAELRLLEAQFGLTPMSRRSLQWELPGEDDEQPAGAAKKAAPRKRAAKKAADPRAAFQVVKGGKAS